MHYSLIFITFWHFPKLELAPGSDAVSYDCYPSRRLGRASAHRFVDASDEAYYTLDCRQTAQTQGLSDNDLRENADSYGCWSQTLD
jgi:hypothetical protein